MCYLGNLFSSQNFLNVAIKKVLLQLPPGKHWEPDKAWDTEFNELKNNDRSLPARKYEKTKKACLREDGTVFVDTWSYLP